MKYNCVFTLTMVTILFTTSCASIVSKSSYPVTINSAPSEATITITGKKGFEVYQGKTPATLRLKAGSGFFSKEHYQVLFKKEGYNSIILPLKCKIDGWYFGNIVFGGLLGLLIVDPATGAMYRLESDYLHGNLTQSTASIQKEFKIYALDEIPDGWVKHLVPLN